MELNLVNTGQALDIRYGHCALARYVYAPDDPPIESPRPYWHPVYTLGGELVTQYRPEDHVWHKGIAWSLPNVRAANAGPANFWGGTTYIRGRGYQQLPNNGAVVHRGFDALTATPTGIEVAHRLDWLTAQGQRWFAESRAFAVAMLDPAAWVLLCSVRMVNTSGQEIEIGSPTTEGRDNAGYGGLFWRGPHSFTGGTVYLPGGSGGDELMGTRADWLAFTGRHDGHQGRHDGHQGRRSTVLFVDDSANDDRRTRWFVRSNPYPCACPAPFFDTVVPVAPGAALARRYAVIVADGDTGPDGAGRLAGAGQAALTSWRRHSHRGGDHEH